MPKVVGTKERHADIQVPLRGGRLYDLRGYRDSLIERRRNATVNEFQMPEQREGYFSRVVRGLMALSDTLPYYDSDGTIIRTPNVEPEICSGTGYEHVFVRSGGDNTNYVYGCRNCPAEMIQRFKPMPGFVRILLGG